MRTGNDDQSAAALPFGTQRGIEERVRIGDCYRGAGSYEKKYHNAERSQPSPDEIHDRLPSSDVQSVHLARSSYMRSDKHRPKL